MSKETATIQEMAEATSIAGEQTRRLEGTWGRIVFIIAIAFVLFQLYTAGFHLFPNLIQRSIHLGFAMVLGFLLFPSSRRARSKGKVPAYDLILVLLTASAVIFTVINYERIVLTIIGSTGDWISSVIFLLVILEVTRRVVGPILPIMAVGACLYVLFGSQIPGYWGHPVISLTHFLEYLYMGTEGLWGLLMNISATMLAMFVIFAILLLFTGGGQAFMNIALLLAGRFHGGAAKVAVVASALFGTISGSTTANVACTGSFTIPTMKRLGYKPEFAAAVEATASSGGQIMPPIMGVAAFVMAELLGIPYLKIITAAAIPATLYFLGVFLAVHFEAQRSGLQRVPQELIPKARSVLKLSQIAPVILPLVILIVFLFQGYTPMRSVFYAIAAALILYLGSSWNKRVLVERLRRIVKAIQGAARGLILVVPLLACAQILIAVINLTGIGVKVSDLIIDLGAGFIPLSLILAMVVCMILGMGISSAAAYLLAAAVVGPALIFLGLEPLAAHLFLFYFAVFGSITPPVCVGVFVASGIANSNWVKTAWIAVRVGVIAFIVPFIFIYSPSLLLVGKPFDIILTCVTVGIGTLALGASLMGFLVRRASLWERAILLGSAVLLFIPGYNTNIPGIILLAVVFLWETFQGKRVPAATEGIKS